jgi:hypothetical protein
MLNYPRQLTSQPGNQITQSGLPAGLPTNLTRLNPRWPLSFIPGVPAHPTQKIKQPGDPLETKRKPTAEAVDSLLIHLALFDINRVGTDPFWEELESR